MTIPDGPEPEVEIISEKDLVPRSLPYRNRQTNPHKAHTLRDDGHG